MNTKRPTRTETLEIEDQEARFRRIQTTLEKLDTSSRTPSSRPISFPLSSPHDRPHALPPSDVLSRVQAFLPALEASNALLEQHRQQDPNSVDIEHISEGTERYIEMDLGLGLFERRRGHSDGAEDTSDDDDDSSDSSSEEGTDSDDSITSSDNDHKLENGMQAKV